MLEGDAASTQSHPGGNLQTSLMHALARGPREAHNNHVEHEKEVHKKGGACQPRNHGVSELSWGEARIALLCHDNMDVYSDDCGFVDVD